MEDTVNLKLQKMKTSRENRFKVEIKDELQKEKDEIQNEKEELHELFELITTQNKNNRKKAASGEASGQ